MSEEIRERWLDREFQLPLFSASGDPVGHVGMRLVKIEVNDCLLEVSGVDGETRSYSGYNCHQCLDKYRKSLDEVGVLIGCYGAVRNFYVTKGMARHSYGLEGLLTNFGSIPITGSDLKKETFAAFSDVSHIASVFDQKYYRIQSMDNQRSGHNP